MKTELMCSQGLIIIIVLYDIHGRSVVNQID